MVKSRFCFFTFFFDCRDKQDLYSIFVFFDRRTAAIFNRVPIPSVPSLPETLGNAVCRLVSNCAKLGRTVPRFPRIRQRSQHCESRSSCAPCLDRLPYMGVAASILRTVGAESASTGMCDQCGRMARCTRRLTAAVEVMECLLASWAFQGKNLFTDFF